MTCKSNCVDPCDTCANCGKKTTKKRCVSKRTVRYGKKKCVKVTYCQKKKQKICLIQLGNKVLGNEELLNPLVITFLIALYLIPKYSGGNHDQ